jgi:hypothetical protein
LKKNSLILIILGLLLLAVGTSMQFGGTAPKADPALVQRCQEQARERGMDAATAAQCENTAFATALTATDADAAARAISTANGSEIGGTMVAMFLIGLGLILTIGGVIARRAQRR